MYTFYEYPKCSTCRKAKAELNQLGLDVESINIKENPPSAQFLKELLEGSDLELKKFFKESTFEKGSPSYTKPFNAPKGFGKDKVSDASKERHLVVI